MKNKDQPITPVFYRQTEENTSRLATDKDIKEGIYLKDYPGLSKREYAAIHIMSGLAAKYTLSTPEDQVTISTLSIQLADTLLTSLEK